MNQFMYFHFVFFNNIINITYINNQIGAFIYGIYRQQIVDCIGTSIFDVIRLYLFANIFDLDIGNVLNMIDIDTICYSKCRVYFHNNVNYIFKSGFYTVHDSQYPFFLINTKWNFQETIQISACFGPCIVSFGFHFLQLVHRLFFY